MTMTTLSSRQHRRSVGDSQRRKHQIRRAARSQDREGGRSGVMFLLDTNVVSELRKAKSGKAHPLVTACATKVPAGSLYLSAITLREL